MTELRLDEGSWDLECTLLEHLAEVWDQPDPRHLGTPRRGAATMCSRKSWTWVAFDRAIKSAERFRAQGAHRAMVQATIRHPSRGLRKGAFDPTLEFVRRVLRLAIARCQHSAAAVGGFLAGLRPAGFAGTIAAHRKLHDARRLCAAARSARNFRREAADRRRVFWPAASGSPTPMCWRASFAKAQTFVRPVWTAVANDLGLLAEEFDTGPGAPSRKYFPQALTHIALITHAHNLCDAKRANEKACDAKVEVACALSVLPAGSSSIAFRKSLVLVRGGDMRWRGFLTSSGGIAHRERQAAHAKTSRWSFCMSPMGRGPASVEIPKRCAIAFTKVPLSTPGGVMSR